jgi:hypothetical protein
MTHPTRASRCLVRVAAALAATAIVAGTDASNARAQYPDARLVPRGVLRISFEPQYWNARERFDAADNVEALGTDFSDSTAGVRLFPTIALSEQAVRSLTGDSAYATNAGAFRTTLEADVRRFPLELHFGITDWLSLSASVPFVTTRSQVSFVVDSTSSNVGWNQIASQAGNAAALGEIQALLTQLEAAAQSVEAQISAGGYDCPAGPICDQARSAVTRARQIALDVTTLSGADAAGNLSTVLPPFAPLASSSSGLALLATIQNLAVELQTLGAPAVTATLPLPNGRLAADDINGVLTGAGFGYEASPLQFSKLRQALGDAAVGLRIGLLRKRQLRTLVSTTVRLPTGTRDLPDHFTDIGSGDRQMDVIMGLEAAWEPGAFLALAAGASYTLQLADNLPRRVTAHDQPLAPLDTRADVERNLGDELRIGVFPSLRLNDSFVVYGSMHYYRKSADGFALSSGAQPSATVDPADLGFETERRTLSFGGGIAYRATSARSGPTLPVEAGIDYRATFSGSGGQTPKSTTLGFYLRLFWRLFGGAATE